MFNLGTHSVAAIKTSEEYSSLRESLKNIAKDVNELTKDGYITVDGEKVPIKILLGGDYKVCSLEVF